MKYGQKAAIRRATAWREQQAREKFAARQAEAEEQRRRDYERRNAGEEVRRDDV